MTGTQPPSADTPANRRNLVLIGASVRAAAESARRGGYHVTGIDHFGDADTRRACDAFFRFPTSDSSRQAAIISHCRGRQLLYVGGIGRSELTRQLESVCQLAGPTRQGEQRLRNFAVLRELASSAGVEFPETCDQRSIPSGQEDFVWLHKQTGSSGGLGVTRYTPGDRWPGRGTLQRWVAGRPHGATFLCRGGQARLLGVCRSLVTRVGRRHFVYAGSLGPLVLAVDTMRAVERLGQAVVEQEPLQGLFNVDVIVGQSGRVTLLEVNPRWSASSELIERGLVDRGRKPVSLLEIALEQDLEAEALPEWNGVCHLKRILYARRKLAIPAGGFNFANRTNQSIHDLPVAPAVIAAGHPVATLITRLDGSATFCAADYRRTIRELVG